MNLTTFKNLRQQIAFMKDLKVYAEEKDSFVPLGLQFRESKNRREAIKPNTKMLMPTSALISALSEKYAKALKVVTIPIDIALLPATLTIWGVTAIFKATDKRMNKRAAYAVTGLSDKKHVKLNERSFNSLVDHLSF